MFRTLSILFVSLPLVAALSLPARAADTEYLFDLTADEIVRLMDEYAGERNYDSAEVLARMTAPFDCRHFENLCDEIGADYTYLLLEEVWLLGRLGTDTKNITAALESLLPRLASSFLETHYPTGIDPRDLYFGVPADPDASECTEKVVHVTSGSFRLRVTSRKADAVLVYVPFGQSEFFKKNSRGKFRPERADRIRVDSQHFFTTDDIPNVETKAKERTNDKQVTVLFGGGDVGNAIQDIHVESCGLAGDAVFLQTCACTGARPAIYEGL